ncbi:MAG: AMP-binding protein [Lachnospiraceae bacterium]|nr:AMP-binding protein [Lachnospiraceae bacterium]
MTDNFVTIKEFVDEIGKKYADNIAYRFFREEVIEDRTYTNLRNDAFSLASFFVSKKYVNKHIAILGGTSYEWVVSFLAVIMSGNIVVPIDKMLLEKEMMFLFEQGDIDVILYDEEFEQIAKDAKKGIKKVKNIYCMLSEDFAEALKTKEVELPETDPDALAEILFTSGTTGVSKGVMLSQTNIVNNIIEIRRKDYASNVSGNPVVLSVLPIHHTFELTVDNLGILAYGVTICINDKLENIAANMNLFKPSVILIVPAIAEALYKKVKDAMNTPSTARKMKGGQKLVDAAKVLKMDVRRSVYKQLLDKFGGNLTNVVVGGAALRPEICELFDKFGINVYQGYGLTECAPLVASNDPGNNKVGSVGKCVSYMEAKTINGEIVVKGPGVMLGYYKNEEATAEAIKDGWFYTGDLGYIDEDGYIFITGRSKNIIILDNGKNIYPEELEDKIITIDGVKDVFVYSDKGRLCTLILPENPGDKDKKKAIEGAIKKLNETLPAYKRITFISFTHREFPKTTTLKIKRKDLMEMIKTQLVKNEVKYVPASNPTEEKLVNAFEQILSKRVGIYDDFFELGGDSLSALELAAIVGINAQELYEYPTVESLARFMQGTNEFEAEENRVDVNSIILKNSNVLYKNPHKCVFLTGATGFLGAHILRELLRNKVKVVCLVRNEERLRQTLGRYFPKEYKYYNYKVVKGDIEAPHFGLNDVEYSILVRKVDTVIHTAANVHHAGHYEDFERTNVWGTQNVINFCKDARAVLHYTSTASVNGVGTVSIPKTDKVFDEFVLDIGQNYVQNVYIHSKYKAEEAVLLARQDGLKVNIYRIGNLTWRMSDGMFQKNAEDNGFIGRARGLFKAGLYSPEMAEFPMDFTAVDECANAYVKLVLHNRINNIYHLYNPHLFTIEKLANKLLFPCKVVSRELFDKLIREKIMDKDVAVLSFYSSIASNSRNVPVKNDYTCGVLQNLGFKWSKIGFHYLKYIKRFM